MAQQQQPFVVTLSFLWSLFHETSRTHLVVLVLRETNNGLFAPESLLSGFADAMIDANQSPERIRDVTGSLVRHPRIVFTTSLEDMVAAVDLWSREENGLKHASDGLYFAIAQRRRAHVLTANEKVYAHYQSTPLAPWILPVRIAAMAPVPPPPPKP